MRYPMARKNTIRLLLVNASDNEAERLISLFRAAGRVARAQRLNSANDLHKHLAGNVLGDWDLLIADDQHPALTVQDTLPTLHQHPPPPRPACSAIGIY